MTSRQHTLTDVRVAAEGIDAGDIAWHALPFTTHSEIMDDALFRHGLGLSQILDRRFGRRTLDDFARALAPVRNSLPVVTGELGDMWIHGTGTDPWKTSRFRALCRLHRELAPGASDAPTATGLRRMADRLLLVPEHTWGLNCSVYLFEPSRYARPDFEAVRGTPPYRRMEQSWEEQREYVRQAAACLDNTPLAAKARAALADLEPRPPCGDGLPPCMPDTVFETPHFRLAFDAATGAVASLTALDGGRAWADATHPLGALRYEVFCLADYERYLRQFVTQLDVEWVRAWAICGRWRGMPDRQPRRRPGRPRSARAAGIRSPAARPRGRDAFQPAQHHLPDQFSQWYDEDGRFRFRLSFA